MYIQTRHGQLFVELANKDKTMPLFLLPGGPGFDHLVYKINQPEFEQEFFIVYHDPRGCGKSLNFEKDQLTLTENIDDIEYIRQALNLPKIMLLGHSYGSMVGLGYAIKYPQYVEKLILIAGAPAATFLDKAKQNLANRGTPEQLSICKNFLWPGMFTNQEEVDEYFNIMRPLYSKKVANNPELAKIFNPQIKCQIDPLNQAFSDNFWGFDFTPELYRITCPTKIICGYEDWINDPIFAEIMHKNIVGSEINYLDSGHAVPFDQHDEYISLCKNFLNS